MDKKITICCLLAILFIPFISKAQYEKEVVPVHFSDTTWYDKGFDLYIGGGMFVGNTFNANYYNGSNLNENNLAYLFDNRDYWRREMMEVISQTYPYISINDDIHPSVDPGGDYDWETRYKVKTLVSFGARYKFRDGWGISLSYTFSRLTANSRCLLETPNDYGNMRDLPTMLMVGKEDRSMIDLSMTYLFSKVHPIVKPFVELGVQFNYAKVKSFDAMLLDAEEHPVGREFSLLNIYDNQGYYPGAQEYDVIFGGPGFGFSGSAGLKICVSKYVSLDPTFYCYAGKTGIYQMKNSPVEGYNQDNRFTFNYGVMLRVVMNDFFFSKR
ncbi:MAG: hypothetical protein MJZ57_06155 [Bacteroidales bacterium]|nr:hypothetical protein [Bacteroidales bacterium]